MRRLLLPLEIKGFDCGGAVKRETAKKTTPGTTSLPTNMTN